ncbi:MAG TPA: protein FlhF [Desulfotignum sp.]|nr:protein FlhF [Desulfotignum sp.]
MNKRIFKAANMQEAIASIKQELGPEAMILSTRKIPKKPRDPYGKEMVEVEAGIGTPLENHSGNGSGDLLASVQADIAEIKDMIAIAGMGSGAHQVLCSRFESAGVLASFLRSGVSEKLACTLIEKASAGMADNLAPEDRIRRLKQNVMHQCLNHVSVKDFFRRTNISGLPHVAAFVGPTGVGKTTTIAKLAAMLHFTRKMRVGLISVDNYRVGAFEQLKAYAAIMGLYCVPAFSTGDLTCALDRMKSMDMILIDTAGHSHYDKEKINEILALMKADFGISVHLTLSVTAESINMQEAAQAFSVFNPDTYVFTKIDEARRCGKVLDQITDMNLPVSLITNGQKVPEDLIVPDRQTLIKIILGRNTKGDI